MQIGKAQEVAAVEVLPNPIRVRGEKTNPISTPIKTTAAKIHNRI